MPYRMQLTEQIPNEPPWMGGGEVLLLAIIPVPQCHFIVYLFNAATKLKQCSCDIWTVTAPCECIALSYTHSNKTSTQIYDIMFHMLAGYLQLNNRKNGHFIRV